MNGLRHIPWRQYLVFIAITSMLFGIMSMVRMTQTVDMFYPRAVLKLADFHSREYVTHTPNTSISVVAASTSEWHAPIPANTDNPQFRVIQFTIDPLPASYTRRLLAVFINNRRIDDLLDNGRSQDFGVILPVNLVLTEGDVIRIITVPDDKTIPPPLEVRAVTLTNATMYRWSKGDSTVNFYGSGGGWWQLTSTMLLQHPDNRDFATQITVNDYRISTLPVSKSSMRVYHMLIPPWAHTRGDVAVTVKSGTWGGNAQDARVLGVAIADMKIQPVHTPWWQIAPSWRLASVILLGVLITFAASLVSLPAFAVGGSISIGLIAVMLIERAYLALWYPQLLVLVSISIALIPLFYAVIDWIEGSERFTPTTRNILVGLVILSIWVKAGGILYPIMRPIDITWHMNKVREILVTGDFAKFYQPGAFSESVMPITEWGENRPMIPYSPFYHFSALAFAIFPWPLEKTATVLNAIIDASRVLIIALIARYSGLSNRVSLLSAIMYAVTPVTFLLHAWGNAPTTTGLWWTLVSTTTLLVLSGKLHERKIFWLIIAIHTVTMLIYTVTAVFHVVFVTILVTLLWIIPNHPARPHIKPMLYVVYGGLAIATVVYYGQYIIPIVERTIPYFLQSRGTHIQTATGETTSFTQYLRNFIPALRYDFVMNPFLYQGILMPVLMVIPGWLLLYKRPVLWVFATAWFSVGLIFMVAGYKIPMVDKQIFYILPIMMICWGVIAGGWWRRGWSGQLLVTVATLYTLVSALYLWVVRIDRAPL